MTTSTHGPSQYLSRATLGGFYGLSRSAVDGYLRRGLIPPPDAAGSRGHLWSRQTLIDARSSTIPTLAAAVPMNTALGAEDLDKAHAYMCPARSGHFVGWTSPSIIGMVEGGIAQWHRVLECARYEGSVPYETSTTDSVMRGKLDAARERRTEENLAVFLLEDEPLGIGQIKVSAESTTAGLQRGRLLRREDNRVGAPGAWLTLPAEPSSIPLPHYSLPLLNSAFPSTWETEQVISAT
jgi:hypothetical protein